MLASAAALAQELQQPAFEGQPVPTPRQDQGASARDQDAAPEQDGTAKLLTGIQGIEAAIRDLITEEDEIERKRENQREIDDLKAQQEMAVWAERMFWATFATVFLTAVGVLLIWRTLEHTKRAAIHAGEAVTEARAATKAARAAVDETKRIGEAQTRAYLSVTDFLSGIHRERISVKITFKNTGQTPARNVRFSVAWASEVPPFKEEWHKLTVDEAEGRGSIGAGMLFYGSVRTDKFKGNPDQSLTTEQIERVLDLKEDFWVFGVIEYDDVFDQFHRTRFRYVMNFDTHGDNVAFSPCAEGNEET